MIPMIAKYVLSFVKFHPDTLKSRATIITVLGGVGVTVSAIATSLSANDPNVLDYIKDCSPIAVPLITMYIRDAIAKGHQKQADIAQKVEDVFLKITEVKA